jgi:hypothetical protein
MAAVVRPGRERRSEVMAIHQRFVLRAEELAT